MKKHLWKILLVLVILVAVVATSVTAADFTFDMAVDGYQNYDEANEILNYVNGYRAEVGAAPLKMEPALMELAMQRAAEISVYYSHTRPNNTSCGTILDGTIFQNRSWGENIAIGQTSALEVSTDWKNSPGHYANMTQTAFKSIGIGCFYQEDGTRCWVQLFSDVTTSSNNTKSGVQAVSNVPITASTVNVSLTVSPVNDKTIELYAGQQLPLQVSAVNKGFTHYKAILSNTFKVTSAKSTIAKANGTAVVGVAAGKTNIYVDVGTLRLTVPVEVSPKPAMSYSTDANGQTVVTWTDTTGKGILFYKKLEDDNWTYAGNSGSYTLKDMQEDDVYLCVLRVWSGDSYVDITDELIVGNMKPQINTQPTSKIVKAGATAKLTVQAMGVGLTYQWQYRTSSSDSWKNASATGYNTATLSIPATTGRHGYQYRCRITDANGEKLYSKVATLYVLGVKTQPTSKIVKTGATAKLTVEATGKSVTYQWQYRTSSSGSWKNVSAASGKTANYSLTAAVKHHGYQYRCQITDSKGNVVYTNAATLYVLGVKTQPASKIVKTGATAKLTVAATGHKLTYQWQYRTSSSGSWKNASATGNKTKTLSVAATVAKHGYQYRCKVTDSAGNVVYSNAATLYVLGVKTQPANKTVKVGATAKFTVSATGKGLTYQWQYRTSSSGSWKNISAASGKTANYSMTAAVRHHGYQYRCKVTDSAGNVVYTNAATLYVLGIKTQPANKTVKVGATAKFTVSATGKGLTYQWQYRTSSSGSWKNISVASGKTANYSMTAAARHNGYQYRCKITDSAGNVIYSDIVKLTVKK